MWTAFIVGVAVLTVALALATGAWIIVFPLALLLAAVGIGTYFLRHKGQTGRMRHLREQAHGTGPRDRGGVEFTDRDRETLSS